MNLGPNGGLVYAMEYLVENIDWLQVQMAAVMVAVAMLLLLLLMLLLLMHDDVLSTILHAFVATFPAG